MAHIGETAVDEQSAVVLGFDDGAQALLSCSIRTETPQEAVISGTKGWIKIHSPYWCPTTATISVEDRLEVFNFPVEGNGYNYEAQEVMRCLRAGKLESDIIPLDESLAVAKTMDNIRAQWGLKYPME